MNNVGEKFLPCTLILYVHNKAMEKCNFVLIDIEVGLSQTYFVTVKTKVRFFQK